MHDPRAVRRPVAVLVHPAKRLPVRRDRNIAGDLNRSGLEIDGLKLQTLARLDGDPVRNVVLVDRDRTDRRPAKETLVPQSRIGREVVLLNVAPIVVLKFPKRLLIGGIPAPIRFVPLKLSGYRLQGRVSGAF